MLRKYWGGQLFAEYVLLNEAAVADRSVRPEERDRRHDRPDHRHGLYAWRHQDVLCLFEPGNALYARSRRHQRLLRHFPESRRL